MAFLAPIHRPSSVRHALKLCFLNPDDECLIVAKSNRIEIYIESDEGLVHKHTKAIYGKITMLERLQPANSRTEHLFIGTDRYKYFTVSWDATKSQLRTEQSYHDQADKTLRDSQTQDRCLIDPSRRYMTLQLFDGIITVVPIIQSKLKQKSPHEPGCLGEPVPARIPELFVRSSAFLHSLSGKNTKPKIALLYENNRQKVCLVVRTLDYAAGNHGETGSADLDEVDVAHDDLEPGASHLIPVPAPAYGLLILAETSITYCKDGKLHEEPLQEASIFVAWAQVDAQRWLLADDYGKLYFLMLLLDDKNQVLEWKLDMIGQASRASTLVYLGSGLVYVGSHQGDSQVIRIQERSIEIMQTLPNIAPILDFTIMDMGSRAGEAQTNDYSSGQARIVTGSGAFQDGSLRSVRSGVGMEELGLLLEASHIADLFPLRSTSSPSHVDILLVSFVEETRVFQFQGDGEVEEKIEHTGLALTQGTLLATNMSEGLLLQVTASSARVVDLEDGMAVHEWLPPQGQTITAASAIGQRLSLAIGGTEFVVLDTSPGGTFRVVARRNFQLEGQISCIHIPNESSGICIAGFWQSTSIAILKLDTLETISKVAISDDSVSVPRSILLAQILPSEQPTLFIAMANGEVVTFSMSLDTFSLSARKAIVLGTQQANFKALPTSDGLCSVFATCEHPSLIYGSEGRIVYSAVTAEKATCVCPFDSEAYPGAIAVATPQDLKIALVDTERTTHVNTLPIGETVRRVAYSTTLKTFGIGTIRRTLQEGYELVKSYFKLVDEVVFKLLDSFDLNDNELVESVARADLRDGSGDTVERFIVGTAYLEDQVSDTARGRILILAVTQDRTLKLVTELPVKGACRALGCVDGNIVAALVKTVVIYTLEGSSLYKAASYRTSTAPIDIAVKGNLIAIVDLMKSVSVVEYNRGTEGLPDTLEEKARHFQTAWGTAVAHVDTDTILESDAEGNLMVLHQNTSGVTSEDRRRLEITSEIRLGEMVNRIRSFEVPTSTNATVVPKAFLGTVDGSIYLFALIAPSYRDLLMRLQSNMAAMLCSPGDVPFNSYRAFKNSVREAEEPFRFVDGELVERFLDCSKDEQDEMCKGLGTQKGKVMDAEDIKGIVEGLRRLH